MIFYTIFVCLYACLSVLFYICLSVSLSPVSLCVSVFYLSVYLPVDLFVYRWFVCRDICSVAIQPCSTCTYYSNYSWTNSKIRCLFVVCLIQSYLYISALLQCFTVFVYENLLSGADAKWLLGTCQFVLSKK